MTASERLAKFADRLRQFRLQEDGRAAFCREVLGFEPHVGQQRWLRNARRSENALVTGNRWGKSFTAGAELVLHATYREGWDRATRLRMDAMRKPYHTINVAMTADQAKIVWSNAYGMLQSPKASWLVADVKMTPFPVIQLINGAIIEARSTAGNGERLLGNSYDFINWDEAAFEKNKNFKQIRDNVLRMRLVDRKGTLNYTSTGNGRNDFGLYFLSGLSGKCEHRFQCDVCSHVWFAASAEECLKCGGDSLTAAPLLYSQTGPTYENTNIPHDAVDRNAARMSDAMRRQNILGEIVDGGGGFFSVDDLEAALDDDLTAMMVVHARNDQEQIEHAEIYSEATASDIAIAGGLPWHNRYPSHRYVHFWDLANKRDWVVGWTIDTSLDQMVPVEFERFQKKGWSYNFDRIRARHHKYAVGEISSGMHASSRTIVDSTGVGDVAVDNLSDIGAEGFLFTKPSKDQILSDLQAAFSLRALRWPMIPVAYDEHKFYVREDEGITQDTVMALAGAVHFSKRTEFVFEGY